MAAIGSTSSASAQDESNNACKLLGTCDYHPGAPPRNPMQVLENAAGPDIAECRRLAEQRDGPLFADIDKAKTQYGKALELQSVIAESLTEIQSARRSASNAQAFLVVAHVTKIASGMILGLAGEGGLGRLDEAVLKAGRVASDYADAGDIITSANDEELAFLALTKAIGPVGDTLKTANDIVNATHEIRDSKETLDVLDGQIRSVRQNLQRYILITKSAEYKLGPLNARKNLIDKICGK